MPELTITMTTPAPPDQVWALIKRGDTFPSFMDEVVAVDIVESTGGGRTSSWSVRLEGAVLEWTQRESLDEDRRILAFEQVDGDLSALSGGWRVDAETGGGSRVTVDVMFEIGIPLLADVLNPPAVRALRDNFQRILDKIEVQFQHGLS
jgi:ribosome-associated toxin RatA of RatAB toxin-antitoxin module